MAHHSAVLSTFRQASRQVMRELGFFRNLYGETGITSFQAHILLELDFVGEASIKELTEALCSEKSTTSRTVQGMLEKGWLKEVAHQGDQRFKPVTLSKTGHEHVRLIHKTSISHIQTAFEFLIPQEQEAVMHGMGIYAKALQRTRVLKDYVIRPLQKSDNSQILKVISKVVPEFGTSLSEMNQMIPESATMYEHYKGLNRGGYWVVDHCGEIVGGAGVGPLKKAKNEFCELQKMYLLKEHRGQGIGELLLKKCLSFAKAEKYSTCYLDTRSNMHHALKLYRRHGFKEVQKPLGANEHWICDSYFVKDLAKD